MQTPGAQVGRRTRGGARPGNLGGTRLGRSFSTLVDLFAEWDIYPRSCYVPGTPLREFQSLFPDSHFARDAEELLSAQPERSSRRGADLPWWGSRYFSEAPGRRTMIVSQDSLAPDAGSVAFFACLFGHCESKPDYLAYTSHLEDPKLFPYASWARIRALLQEDWALDLDLVYITDARKVYRLGPKQIARFNGSASRQLLQGEIEVTRPDLIVILGAPGVSLLFPDTTYADLVDERASRSMDGVPVVVSPFPIGNGRAQPGFAQRLQRATRRIRA